MGYTLLELAEVIEVLREKGIDGVIIGSTVLAVTIGAKELEDDVDLFVTSFSPTIEEQKIRDVAKELGWDLGRTGIDTLSIIARKGDKEIVIELYENIYDFYVPSHVINNARRVRISGRRLKLIRIEDYILLKARRGSEFDLEDLRVMRSMISSRELRIDEGYLKKSLLNFPEEDRSLIISRLRSVNFKISV
ncbi:MAG: nucleotidyltransferase [Thermoprotei archaeon]|nr:MAG: nucleotidyltransferase [Thermoprotei archaeon]